MAMTKAEKAHIEELETRLALRFTIAPMPIDTDVALEVAKAQGRHHVQAWTANSYSGSVTLGWFTNLHHSREGNPPQEGGRHSTTSLTRGGPWFLNKADALRWARTEMEKKFATELRKLDIWIEAAEANRSATA